MSAREARGRRYYQVLGVVFLLIVLLFLTATIGSYNKLFTSAVPVRLETNHIGNQMHQGADVKVHGVVVGEVRTVQRSGDHAELRLALEPEKVQRIPANVSAQLLPKTLFGERYVDLKPPHNPVSARLDSGSVIGQDRSRSAIETEQVLQTLMPVLKTLQPDKVASTLGAVSQALQGRGKKLGETLVGLGDYLRKVEPALPDLQHVTQRLDSVAQTYTKAGPQLLQALNDLGTTSQTIARQHQDLQNMVGSMTASSTDLNRFLQANQDNIIDLSSKSRSTMELLAKYAPEYPCMIGQMADSLPNAARAFGKGSKHPNLGKFTIEITGSRGKYVPGRDTPRYQEARGPRCYPWAKPPNTFPQYPPGGPIKDGSTHPTPPNDVPPLLPGMGDIVPPQSGSNEQSSSPASTKSGGKSTGKGRGQPGTSSQAAGGTPSLANSPAEQRLLATLLAPSMRPGGGKPSDVPDWSSLLVGPLFRGAEVSVK